MRFISNIPPHHRYQQLPSVHCLLSVPLANIFKSSKYSMRKLVIKNEDKKRKSSAHFIAFVSWRSDGSRRSIFTLKERDSINTGLFSKGEKLHSSHNNEMNKVKIHTGYPATPWGPGSPGGPWCPSGPRTPVSPHWPMFPCSPFRR